MVKKEGESEAGMDPRMEREMMKMADEFSKMDEKNPDPRVMGRMMRRMMEASGQKLPTEMGEMLQRLEKGENPDKLEEEYGDVMEKMDGMEGAVGQKKEDWKIRLRRRMPPRRDQKLPTEMGEMLQRLEKGENPDKLEEEYGDVMEKMDGMEGAVGIVTGKQIGRAHV